MQLNRVGFPVTITHANQPFAASAMRSFGYLLNAGHQKGLHLMKSYGKSIAKFVQEGAEHKQDGSTLLDIVGMCVHKQSP